MKKLILISIFFLLLIATALVLYIGPGDPESVVDEAKIWDSPTSGGADSGTDVTTNVSTNDEINATIDVYESEEGYGQFNWTNSLGADAVQHVNVTFEYIATIVDVGDTTVTIQFWNVTLGGWQATACSDTVNTTSFENYTCVLDNYYNATTVDDVRINMTCAVAGLPPIKSVGYCRIDYVWLEVNYTLPGGDTTPPNVTINNPNAGVNYSGNILINATVVDDVQVNSSTVFYWLENASGNVTAWTNMSNVSSGDWTWYNATFVSTSISDGIYNVTINASDNSSNPNVSEKVEFTIDNTPPAVGYIAPSQDEKKISSFLINVSVNDTGSGVQNAYYWIENVSGNVTAWTAMSLGAGTIYEGYWNATYDPSALAYDKYNITTNATDYTGNRNVTKKRQFIYTTPILNVTLITPATGSSTNVSQNTTFRVNASVRCMNGGCGTVVGSVRYNRTTANPDFLINYTDLNGIPFSNSTGQIPWSCGVMSQNDLCTLNWTVNATGTINTSYYLDVNFTSSLSQTPDNDTANFQINISKPSDQTAPSVTINDPNAGENHSGDILINATITDSDSGVNSSAVYYWIENASGNVTAWTNLSNISSGNWQWYNATFVTTSVSDGTYNVTINASDIAGNKNVSEKVEFVIDNTNPRVGFITPLEGQNITSSFLINVSINDTTSGVESVYYWFENVSGNVTEWEAMSLGAGNINTGYWNATLNSGSLSDGLYNITINSTDYASNKNVSVKVEIRIDNTPPAVTINDPDASGNYSGNMLINATITDSGSGVDSSAVYYWIENVSGNVTAWTAMSNISSGNWQWYNATFDTTTISDGTYNVTINASDIAGNENVTEKIEFTIDNNRPSVGFIAPGINANISSSFLINASVNDSGTGVEEVYYWLEQSGSNVTEWKAMSLGSGNKNNGYWNATASVASLSDGLYNITINATDYSDLQNASVKNQIRIDKTVPAAGFISPGAGSNFSSNFLLNTSANDTGSGVQYGYYWIENVSGNVTAWTAMSLGAGNINIGYWNATVDISSVSDGLYNITINFTDYAGKQNATEKQQVRIDKTSPSVIFIDPNVGENKSGNMLINASISDSGSDVYEVYYWLEQSSSNVTAWTQMTEGVSGYWNASFDTTTLSDGLYNVTVNASDYAGNENVTEKVEFTIDNTEPKVGFIAPGVNANISSSFLLNTSINDTGSGIQNAYYWLEQSGNNVTEWKAMSLGSGNINIGYWNATVSVASLSDGLYNITINASDYVNLENATEKRQIRIDKIRPLVGIVSPTNASNQSGNMLINASINDTGSGVQNAYYWIENASGNVTAWTVMSLGTGTIYQGYWNATYDTFSLTNGSYNVTINATDYAGKQNASQKNWFNISVTVDNTPPSVTINDPNSGGNYSGSILINATITDNVLVNDSDVYYWLEQSGSNVTAWIQMSNISSGDWTWYNATFVTTSMSNGIYNVTINASDNSSNENVTEKIEITIDNTNPRVGFITPLEGQNKSGSILINVSINDTTSGVQNAYYWLEQSGSNVTEWKAMSLGTGTIYQGYWNATFDTSSLSDGLYNITINSTDYTSNQNATVKVEIKIDNTDPYILITHPSGGQNLTGNQIWVNGTITDNNRNLNNPQINDSRFVLNSYTPGNGLFSFRNDSQIADGTVAVKVNFTDDAGNTNTSDARTFVFDNTRPKVGFITPLEGQNITSSFLINVSINDTTSGVQNVYYWLEQSGNNVTEWKAMSLGVGNINIGYWNATMNSGSLADGTYNITINATDYVDLENASVRVEITIDNNRPSVGFIAPGINANLSSNFLVNASVNDSGTGVKEVYYWIGNASGNVTAWKAMSLGSGNKNNGYWNATASVASLSDGLYNITINATDYSDLQNASVKNQIRIDTSRPLVGIVSPSSGQNVSGNLLINANVSDTGSGVYLVYYWLNQSGSNVTAWTQMTEGVSGYWNATFNTNPLSDGLYNVTVNASDYAKNENVSEKVEFTIDNTPPYISITIPSEGQNLSGNNITVNGTVTDNNKVLNNPAINDSRFTLSSYNSGTGSFVFANNTQVEGSLSVVVNFTDDAGNTNTSNAKSFKVDNSAPAVGIINPTSNQEISGSVIINASINDSISGIQNAYYWFENSSGGNQTEWKSMSLGSGTIYQGYWNATFDTSLLPNGWYNITINSTDYTGNQNASVKVQVRIVRAAYVTNVDVFPDNPLSTQDLNCSWNATSEGGSNLTANVTWWKDSTRITTYDVENISCVNASLCHTNVTVDSSDTSPGEVWTCQVTVWNIWNSTATANGSETILRRLRGGGGGPETMRNITIPPKEIIKELHVFGWIKSRERKTFAIQKHEELKIRGLGVSLKDSHRNVYILLEKSIYDLETIIDVPKRLGKGYSYVNISSDIPDESLLSLTIDFEIKKEWFEENNLTLDQISLYKFGDRDMWEELPTIQTTEDEENIYFASLSSEFGTFVSMGGDAIGICDITCPLGQAVDPVTCECVVIPSICYITCPEGQVLDEENCICIEEIEEAAYDWPWSILMTLLIILAALLILVMVLLIKKLTKDLGIEIKF